MELLRRHIAGRKAERWEWLGRNLPWQNILKIILEANTSWILISFPFRGDRWASENKLKQNK